MTRSLRSALSLVLLAGTAIFVPALARADDASKRAKVEELFTIMKIDAITGQITNSVMSQTQTLAQRQYGPNPTPEQQKQYDTFRGKVMTLVTDNVGWKVMEPEFIKLYTDTYTEPEVDGMLGFYKSPVGQAMLAKAPELSQKSMGLAQNHMVAIQPQLRQLVQDFINQSKPAGTGAGPGTASPGASTTTPPPASTRPSPSLNAPPKP